MPRRRPGPASASPAGRSDEGTAVPDGSFERAEAARVRFSWRRGCRGHPDVPVGFVLLAEAGPTLSGSWVDASGTLALAARAAADAQVRVLEPSAIALSALRHDLAGSERIRLEAGLPWDLAPASVDGLILAPPAERGSARVIAELDAAAFALRAEGELLLLLHKDLGAKRYEKEAARRFRDGGVVARSGGARLSRWRGPVVAPSPPEPWISFEVDGRSVRALAGCHAAGKLDPGTAQLLRALADAGVPAREASVLDLGCGWGPLARAAAERGARVVALDDDLAAVRSCRVNVPEAHVMHADGSRADGNERRFDVVLVNPPFHVGKAVRTELGRALLRRAAGATSASGELWWVANRDLRYETDPLLAGATRRRDEGGFRVFRWSPRSDR